MPAADDHPGPLAEAERDALFAPLGALDRLALAVSGGADSLALMVLAAGWRKARKSGPELTVFTVDHGLRDGSADEAAMVATVAAGLGLRHRTLVWRGAKPQIGVEEAAREARYALLAEACQSDGIADLVTAHHRDDQAETVLMRLGKGSGLAGLAGMRAVRPMSGMRHHRPLLGVPKARLAAVAVASGLTPARDESNCDPRFQRPRLRRLAGAMDEAGVTPAGIARSAQRLAQADEALEHYAGLFIADAVAVDAFGVVRFALPAFHDAPREIRQRALARLIAAASGGNWPPVRHERLAALETTLVSGEEARRTLGGAVIVSHGDAVTIHREAGRQTAEIVRLAGRAGGIWDGRFAYRIAGVDAALTLGPLGEAGRRNLGLRSSVAPPGALAALPAIRAGAEIIAVPSVGFAGDGGSGAEIRIECIVGARALDLRSEGPSDLSQ